jgi:hypothetical protein
MKLSSLFIAVFTVASICLQTGPMPVDSTAVAAISVGKRTVNLAKSIYKTATEARTEAEKRNKGWKVTKVKGFSKHWRVYMEK